MKEALGSSETSVLTRATRRNIPEDTILLSHRRENLKSYIINNPVSSIERTVKLGHLPLQLVCTKQHSTESITSMLSITMMINNAKFYPLKCFKPKLMLMKQSLNTHAIIKNVIEKLKTFVLIL
jgi:hypothetical protein